MTEEIGETEEDTEIEEILVDLEKEEGTEISIEEEMIEAIGPKAASTATRLATSPEIVLSVFIIITLARQFNRDRPPRDRDNGGRRDRERGDRDRDYKRRRRDSDSGSKGGSRSRSRSNDKKRKYRKRSSSRSSHS